MTVNRDGLHSYVFASIYSLSDGFTACRPEGSGAILGHGVANSAKQRRHAHSDTMEDWETR